MHVWLPVKLLSSPGCEVTVPAVRLLSCYVRNRVHDTLKGYSVVVKKTPVDASVSGWRSILYDSTITSSGFPSAYSN